MKRTALLLIAVLAACSGDSDGTGIGTPDIEAPGDDDGSAVIVTTTTPATATPATTPALPTTTGTAAGEPDEPISTTSPSTTTSTTVPVVGDPSVATEVVARGLAQPVDLAVRPGDDALYVVEQPGRVVRIAGGEIIEVADVGDRITAGGERGLLGMAFAPDGRLAYLDYTDRAGDTVIAEYPVDDTGMLVVEAERVLLVVDQPYSNHNAGDLAIGPDGMLWVPLGDGGSRDDPERRSSDPGSLLGSLLRIDPTTPGDDRPYSIPADNPFATGGAGAPEVWAWGLRNPWKIAFDPLTAELWIADVGQNEFEEVNVVAPTDGHPAGRGADFGWSAFEGFERFNTDVDDPGDTVPPVLTYRHGDDGCSISGGAPYRGSAIAGLAPAYVYSDYCSGKLWALDLAGARNLTLLEGFESVTAVRAGPDGELYVLEHGGTVHRLVAG